MDATQRCVVTPSRGLLDEGDVSAVIYEGKDGTYGEDGSETYEG